MKADITVEHGGHLISIERVSRSVLHFKIFRGKVEVEGGRLKGERLYPVSLAISVLKKKVDGIV